MKTRKKVMAAACAAIASSAFAQGAPGTQEIAPSSLKALTVTANKIEERLQDVPQSVTLITADELQQRSIRNMGDLVREVPNLSSSFLYSNDLNFRGINSSTFTNANPLVMYVDGVPQSNRIAYDALLENVDRVEILRGPQGSLYGKDAIGGVINIITRTPGNIWTGEAGVELANLGGRDLSFALNGPLIKDELFITMSGKATHTDGWVGNSFPGQPGHANRASAQRLKLGLLYQMSARTRIRLNASHDQQDNHGADGGLVPYGMDYRSLTREQASHARFDQDTTTRTRSNAQSLAVQHRFDELTLDAVLTSKSIRMDGDYDIDWSSGNPLYDGLNQYQHSTIDTRTQELRLSRGKEGELRWLGGLYAEQEKSRNTRYGMQYPGAMMGMPGVTLDMDAPSTTRSGTQALFGQVMAPLLKDLELTLGGRYQRIRKDFDAAMYMQPAGTSGAAPVNAISGATHTWSAFLPKAALSYGLNAQWKTYVSVAKGYLPGGYNYWPSSSVEKDNRFGPQTSTNYELGLRSGQGPLYLSAALFLMDIKDIHVYAFDRASGMIQTSNGGKGKSHGLELEAGYLITPEWEINGSLGLVRATYDGYAAQAGSSGNVASGNRIEKTPAYTAALGLQYMAAGGFYARGDVRGQGRRYFNAENTWQDPAYATVDLKLGYKTGPWDLYAYVRNLTDTAYRSSVNSQSSGALLTFGEPRRIGVGARYRF